MISLNATEYFSVTTPKTKQLFKFLSKQALYNRPILYE